MGLNRRRPFGLAAVVTTTAALGAGIAFAGIPLPLPRPASAPAKVAPGRPAPIPLPQKRPQTARSAAPAAAIVFAPPDSATAAIGHMPSPPLPKPLPPPAREARNTTPLALPPATVARHAGAAFAMAPTASTPASDVEKLRDVIAAARKGRDGDADAAEHGISDPLARKLAEYIILRSNDTSPSFSRYAAFVAANPTWPHSALFRRRAEAALWNDKVDDATVRAYFADREPISAKGRYVLARALLAAGQRDRAATLVRYAWRNEDCSAEVESRIMDMFGDLLTPADHRARMENRLYNDDAEAGLRAAERIGGVTLTVAKARAAVIRRAHNAEALLDAVPHSARGEAGYIFARAQWLRKGGHPEEAAKLVLSAPADPLADANQWWQERRILIRKLLDEKDAQTAYRVARNAATPTQRNWRVDKHFTAGWIALRFLHDPKTALTHFAHIMEGTHNPHALSRGGYWQGRAEDALGDHAAARRYYELAARYTATYYGQLARARLGLTELGLVGPPALSESQKETLNRLEVVRAAELLYQLGERDLLASMYAELGESATDVNGLAMLGALAARHHDARAEVLLGSGAYGRGLPLDYYAYPVTGLPDYTPIAPPITQAVAYSIARQESRFNQQVVSSAKAMGLMQVTPEAARDTARRFKAHYNAKRLLSDPVYNMQMGAAELSNLLHYYNGSYILTFAGYNAGMGRVRQWLAAYGDPRDPGVDPVDWVERLPLSETRNYVMRIMENLQVYRARFAGSEKLVIEADIRRGHSN
jgi:soluble lytic murein transglycosylase